MANTPQSARKSLIINCGIFETVEDGPESSTRCRTWLVTTPDLLTLSSINRLKGIVADIPQAYDTRLTS